MDPSEENAQRRLNKRSEATEPGSADANNGMRKQSGHHPSAGPQQQDIPGDSAKPRSSNEPSEVGGTIRSFEQFRTTGQHWIPVPATVDDMGDILPSAVRLGELLTVSPKNLAAGARLDYLAKLERYTSWLAALRIAALAETAGPAPTAPHDTGKSKPALADADADAKSTSASESTASETIEPATTEPGMVASGGSESATTDSTQLHVRHSVQAHFWDHARVQDDIVEEVSLALHISPYSARRRIDFAKMLHHRFTNTWQSLLRGDITEFKAVIMTEECVDVPDELIATIEAEVLPRAATLTPGRFRNAVRRIVLRLCPPTPLDVAEEFARREVTMQSHGVMSTIIATLPTPDAITVWNALTAHAHAHSHPDDQRTMAHKRADALTALANDFSDLSDTDSGQVRQGRRHRGEALILIDLPTLLGLADNPGEIRGVGPIPAAAARLFAAHANSWRRFVTDPITGHLLDYGTSTYRPPAQLRDFVIARDVTCRFPGCEVAAERCDLDHIIPFDHDNPETSGATAAHNLQALCRRHHRLKTHNNWQAQGINGSHWHSPRGQRYSEAQTPLEYTSYHVLRGYRW